MKPKKQRKPVATGKRIAINDVIPPEIKNDEFYLDIQKIARYANIKTVLEIGSSSGDGSTEAWVTGLRNNPNKPTLFCMEISQARFEALKEYYSHDDFVKCYNISSVSLTDFPSEEEIIDFYNDYESDLNYYQLEGVLSWLEEDKQYLESSGAIINGIGLIKEENNIEYFDAVLIDGCEFTGNVELEEVYGAKYILLDDICTFKNYRNHRRLFADPNYTLISKNPFVRNGYSIFRKNDNTATVNIGLPIHFFTIISNNVEPFIYYHIDIFKQLPFEWHWHIILAVSQDDSILEYLEEILIKYPNHITIYHKQSGQSWSKLDMMNAPLGNITDECLLWQIDIDELWMFEQICNARKMFMLDSEKRCAFYQCWQFIGDNLLIDPNNSSGQANANIYARTWKFLPGNIWAEEESPILIERLSDKTFNNIENNAFSSSETIENGLIFQKFSSVIKQELPIQRSDNLGILSLARQDASGNWQFIQLESRQVLKIKQITNINPLIVIDGVFFQMYRTGIARVWRSLLEVWAENGFTENIIVLDRVGTAPKVAGVRYRTIPAYDYNNTDTDRQMLQQICDEEGADIFVSTYYTTPISTPSVFMAYDMIPEVIGYDVSEPMWREKRYGINHASSYISISQNTANDLARLFTNISVESVTVAHCGVDPLFTPATIEEITNFKHRYGITKPYFLLVGAGGNYKNAGLFFHAFSKLATKQGFDIVCTGTGISLGNQYREYIAGSVLHPLMFTDEELRLAYAGAIALVYPSKYEGFGMPVAEAMACGCPVITCPNSSLPEVAGEAAIYVNDSNVDELVDALCEVQKPSVRNSLITAGLAQTQKFSWQNMAEKVSQALIEATLLRLNLREINLIVFPDWSQSEEVIFAELSEVIKTVASHPDQNNITLLIDNSNIAGEEADLILSSILMNLMMEEEIDVTETLEIVLIGELSDIQWQILIPKLKARIILESENQEKVLEVGASNLTNIQISDLLSYDLSN
jgi:glycosyltransferase involved in cell wall biosynthesis